MICISDDDFMNLIKWSHSYEEIVDRNERMNQCSCGEMMKPGSIDAHHRMVLSQVKSGIYWW